MTDASPIPSMGGSTDVPSMTFGALFNYLSERPGHEQIVIKLLNEHLPALRSTIQESGSPQNAASSKVTSSTVKFRPGAALTKEYPEPTPAEAAHALAVSKITPLSVQEIHVLARDFLLERAVGRGRKVKEILNDPSLLSSYAYPDALLQFKRAEKVYACRILTFLMTAASPKSDDVLQPKYASFMNSTGASLHSEILLSATSSLQSPSVVIPEIFEALLASSMFKTYDYGSVKQFMKALINCERRNGVWTIDGSYGSASLLCFMWSSFDSLIDSYEEDAFFSSSKFREINRTLGDISEGNGHAELALVRFGWAVISHGYGGKSLWRSHLAYAMQYDAFICLDELVGCGVFAPEVAEQALKTIGGFFTVVPTCNFKQSQVAALVRLVVDCMRSLSKEARVSVANSFWTAEKSYTHRVEGLNFVMRMAEAFWPYWFEGLIDLLSIFAEGRNAATCGYRHLSEGLQVVCEEGSYSLDQVEVGIKQDDMDVKNFWGSQTLWSSIVGRVSLNDDAETEELNFVKSRCILSETPYRRVVPRGAIGYASSDCSRIIWPVSSDGMMVFGLVLRNFITSAAEGGYSLRSQSSSDLDQAARSAFGLLRKFAQYCDNSIRNLILDKVPASIFIGTFKVLAGVGSRANSGPGAHSERARQRTILSTVSSFLAFMSNTSSAFREAAISSFSPSLVHSLVRSHGAKSLSFVAPFLLVARTKVPPDPDVCDILVSTLLPLWLSTDDESALTVDSSDEQPFSFLEECFSILNLFPLFSVRSPTVWSVVSRILLNSKSNGSVIDCLKFCKTSMEYLLRDVNDVHVRHTALLVREFSSRESVTLLLKLTTRSLEGVIGEPSDANNQIMWLSLKVLELVMTCLNSGEDGAPPIRQLAFSDSGDEISDGLTTLVSRGSSHALRFITETINNQQRSLARAILNPTRERAEATARSAIFQAVIERYINVLGDLEREDNCTFLSWAVRFLRLVWESFRSLWVENAWERNGVWSLLGALLSCKHKPPSWKRERDFTTGWNVSESEVRWSQAVSDALSLFASEILLVNNGEVDMKEDDGPVGNANSVNDSKHADIAKVFHSSIFKAFRASVSETWFDLFVPWSAQNYTRKGKGGMTSEPQQANALIEELTSQLSKTLAQIGGLAAWNNTGSLCYGRNYIYDVEGASQALKRLEESTMLPVAEVEETMTTLNMALSISDSQLALLRSFSEAVLSATFVDILAPAQKELLHSVPYFNGKVSRVLCHCLRDVEQNLELLLEVSRSLAFITPQITAEEFEQPILTSVKRPNSGKESNAASMSPLHYVVTALRRVCSFFVKLDSQDSSGAELNEITEWLLIGASRLCTGNAFSTKTDRRELAEAATSLLRFAQGRPKMIEAISAVLSRLTSDIPSLTPIKSVLSQLSLTSRESTTCESSSSRSTEVLVHVLSQMPGKLLREQRVLTWLVGGVMGNVLVKPCSGYSPSSLERRDDHRLLCSTYGLAARLLQMHEVDELKSTSRCHDSDVLEFTSHSANKLCSASLHLSGDWPPADNATVVTGANTQTRDARRPVLTLARVEEAELACHVIFGLATFTALLRDELPEILENIVGTIRRYIHSAYRLVRAEPVERWIRPISKMEVKRSMAHVQLSKVGSLYGTPNIMSPWALTPPGTPKNVSSSPRRSPLVAIYASMGNAGRLQRGGHIPPSPGMPMTPLQTPAVGGVQRRVAGHVAPTPSPLAVPYSNGLITSRDLTFGEEASRLIMRGLGAALGALRRIGEILEVPLFTPSMQVVEGSATLGLLIAIQYHSCVEVYQRK